MPRSTPPLRIGSVRNIGGVIKRWNGSRWVAPGGEQGGAIGTVGKVGKVGKVGVVGKVGRMP